MVAWSMFTFQTLDLKKSSAWQDVHECVEHDYLRDIRFKRNSIPGRRYMIAWSMTTFQTLNLRTSNAWKGGT